MAELTVTSASARCFREPGVEYPGWPPPPVLPIWDGNPELFELDPDRLGLSNQKIPAGSTFLATGVLGYEWGDYELWPTSLSFTPAVLQQPVRLRSSTEFTVGSLNLYRHYDDVDDPVDPSGRNDVVDNAYDTRRGKLVRYIVDVLDSPDILAVQEAEQLSVLQTLATDINFYSPAVLYTAHLLEGNDVSTLDVGFLIRDSILISSITQLGAAELFSLDGSLLHDRPPLLLHGIYLHNDLPFPVAVMVNHLRSLIGIDEPDPEGDRVRRKRLEQAQSIAAKVQALQTADPMLPLIVIGDFNAFQFSDGYVDVLGQIAGTVNPALNLLSGPDLVDPDLTAEVMMLTETERYSYIHRGNAQALDHALTSAAAAPYVTGFAYGRGNSDAAFDLLSEADTPLRSSDHDGLVLYLDSSSYCSGNELVLQNRTFGPGNWHCTGTSSITAGPNVAIETTAEVTFEAPWIDFRAGFLVRAGGIFRAKK